MNEATGIAISTLDSKFQDFAPLDRDCVVRFTVSEGVWIDVRLGRINEILSAVDAQKREPGQEYGVEVRLGGYMTNLIVRPESNNSATLLSRYG